MSPEDEKRAIAELQAKLERSENFGDVFDVVKKSVKQQLGTERAGLMLVLADLPMHLGAFHGVGTNQIVMNRNLLDQITAAGHPRGHVNSFVYSILLHEYLHSLGVTDEEKVRSLVYEISMKTFGADHPTTTISSKGPWSLLPIRSRFILRRHSDKSVFNNLRSPEIVTDFDRSDRNYIS
jgi:hypothetical protein